LVADAVNKLFKLLIEQIRRLCLEQLTFELRASGSAIIKEKWLREEVDAFNEI
jgi:hypothetical protein